MTEVRVHKSWESVGGIALAIMKGEHDSELEYIRQACVQRLKSRFRKGLRCRLIGTKNVTIEGKECVILKVNQKSITVGIGEPMTEYGRTWYPDGEYNVSPRLLEPVS